MSHVFRFFSIDASLQRASDLSLNERPKQYRHFYPEKGSRRAFTDEQVREMRRAVAAKEISIAELARRLGKNKFWIRAVIDGRSYAHII